MRKTWKSYLDVIKKDDILSFYIKENHSYDELKEKYNITGYSLDRILEYYDIHKSRTQSASLVLKTKYDKFGSKDAYDRPKGGRA